MLDKNRQTRDLILGARASIINDLDIQLVVRI